LALGATICGGALLLAVAGAFAANDPEYRDCSFVAGLDPDYVQLFGAGPGPGSIVTVPRSRATVKLQAAESSFPGDSANQVTLMATVKTRHVAPKQRSGSGTGKVVLQVPLARRRVGRRYTISWAATFDNGMHACPSSATPANTAPTPFVVKVRPGGG
jgi:hypothetical protein